MSSDTVTRAITFSISHVLGDGSTWQDFMATMHRLWKDSTDASNHAIQHYAKEDKPGEKCPRLYAYPNLVERFPSVACGTLATIGRNTERDYRRHRGAFWRGDRAMPLYRYPAPYPIRSQDWRPALAHSERPSFFFSTGQKKGSGIQRWQVVLSGGPGFARQLNQFRQIISGEARPCDLAIYRQRCGETNHNDTSSKTTGGASRVRYRVMVKIVAKFPVQPVREATGGLLLSTDPNAFWVAMHDGREVRPWVLNADEAVRWLAMMRDAHLDHAAKRQRMSEDMKLETWKYVPATPQEILRELWGDVPVA